MIARRSEQARSWVTLLTESEDTPALVRFLFLKALWSNVGGDDDTWMDEWADRKHPIPAAIQRILAKGNDPDDLTDVVRDMQLDVLLNACVSLSDRPGPHQACASHGGPHVMMHAEVPARWNR